MGGHRRRAWDQACHCSDSIGAAWEVDDSVQTPDRIFELGYAFRSAKALMSAVELGVFTALAEVPLDGSALRQRLELNERGAADFFDALVALGLLQRDAQHRYTNTPDADLYLDRGKPSYVGGLLENLNAREYGMWDSLTAALQTGKPQTGFEEGRHFGLLYSDPKRLDVFIRGMTGGTLPVAKAIATKIPWRDYRTVIDVGTAQGCLPVAIAQAHSHIAGGGFDLPAVRPIFESYVSECHLSDRLRFHPGDFFSDPLPAADVLVLGRVLHNWDLPTKRMLLGKAHAALPSGGALIVYDRLIDDERRAGAAGLLSSLNMLIMTSGGSDYTGADCIGWMREIGFRDMRIEPLAIEQSMLVGTK
jgi:O-methyltransferase domain/Dimerisation domain